MVLKIGDTINNFKVKKPLTGGGMSSVYLAEPIDKANNQFLDDVIIKVISKSEIAAVNQTQKAIDGQWKKAIDEFTLTWQIFQKPHENIAKPISWSFSDDKDVVIIITEFVDGPSLSKYIQKQKALKIDRAMFYFKNICEGVKHLHNIDEKRTIIHRDLKSDNIMLSHDLREIKIIDYGIATSFYDNVFESNEGTIYCTANYTTPDILKLTSKIMSGVVSGDPKAAKEMANIISVQFDFHALGIILYEMLTGGFPFVESESETDRAKIAKWLNYDLPLLSNKIANIPTSIDNILFRLTASKPEDLKYRYKNIQEIIDDISTWDKPERKDEPLIKPIDKRNFQQPNSFDVEKTKDNEKVWNKWYMFIIINVTFAILLIIAIVVIVLATTNII